MLWLCVLLPQKHLLCTFNPLNIYTHPHTHLILIVLRSIPTPYSHSSVANILYTNTCRYNTTKHHINIKLCEIAHRYDNIFWIIKKEPLSFSMGYRLCLLPRIILMTHIVSYDYNMYVCYIYIYDILDIYRVCLYYTYCPSILPTVTLQYNNKRCVSHKKLPNWQ